VKTILSLAFLGMVAYCVLKIVPVYVDNYQFQDYLNNTAVDATVRQPQPRPEDLQAAIYSKAESLGLPVERHDINVAYEVYVDLKIYMLPLHFTPSAKNSNI
jgi:hypothetical protein